MDRPDTFEELVLAEIRRLRVDLEGPSASSRPLHVEDRLDADLGLDSLARVELVDRLAGVTGLALGADVLAAATVSELTTALTRAAAGRQPVETSATLPPATARREAPRAEPAAGVPSGAPTTLVEALRSHARTHPEQVSVTLLTDPVSGGARSLTYGELEHEALGVARALSAHGTLPAERIALMLPTCRDYFTTFCGILMVGAIPVPLYPPSGRSGLREHLERHRGILRSCGASLLITVPEVAGVARLMALGVPSLRGVRTPAELRRGTGRRATLPEVRPHDMALIQYTSGSTGDPKGVVLTHADLLANIAALAEAAEVTSADVIVSWLPLYHDMGLIGMWHAPLVLGIPLVVMSPLAFLARPVVWLDAITAHGGTISAAPNFAYAQCVSRVPEEAIGHLDLRSWRLAVNGSEPVDPGTIDAFAERFSPAGFAREAMCPAYGLAEAGLGVTLSPAGRGPRIDSISRRSLERWGRADPRGDGPDVLRLVGCGNPLPGYEVRLVGRGGDALPERREGRIEFRGPSTTAGYFGEPPSAGRAATGGLRWFDTGDLGYLADGELFVTGRAKDVVIRGGRNIHPEDVEAGLAELPGVRPGGVAVFAAAHKQSATEGLVVVAESQDPTSQRRSALVDALRHRTVEVAGVTPDDVVVVAPGAIRRTPSGKVRRGATSDAYRAGTLEQRRRLPAVELARVATGELGPIATRIGSRLAAVAFAVEAWVVVAAVGVLVWLLTRPPVSRNARWWCVRQGVQLIARALRVGIRVEGALPGPDAPGLIVANHASFVDAAALIAASRRPLVFVTSTDFLRMRVVGPFLRRLGCAFVTRGDPEVAGQDVEALRGLVARGSTLAVFPEGSLDPAPGVRPFHLGVFAVAAEAGIPLVPVGIRGSREIVRPGTHRAAPGRICVTVGAPVAPPDRGGGYPALLATAETVRAGVCVLAGEPLLQGIEDPGCLSGAQK